MAKKVKRVRVRKPKITVRSRRGATKSVRVRPPRVTVRKKK